jgi:Na+:H+ antiporter, NhaA family
MSSDHDVHHLPHTFLGSNRLLARNVARPVARFLRIEAAGGMLMLVGTIAALIWFNVNAHGYESFWETEAGFTFGGFGLELTLHEWVNDALMALFFFVVGMEIKREMVAGELRDPRAAALPIVAAFGGMIVPAVIFTVFNAGGEGASGWGIPMATDIAFAVGIVSLLGPRVPVALKLFLLTLAVTDDLGGIAVIATFYSSGLSFGWLGGAAAMLALMVILRRAGVWYFPAYVLLGVIAWYFMLRSGVHATVAGVVAGFLTPTTPLRPRLEAEKIASQLEDHHELSAADVRRAAFLIKEAVPVDLRLTDLLHPWTGYVIIPIFAFANAAIPLNGDSLSAAASSSVTLGVFLGLLVGKTVGVTGAALVALKLGWARRPRGVTDLHILGAAIAAGIGFTVAIFVAGLAFDDLVLQEDAKIGIFAASISAAVLSLVVLNLAARRASPEERQIEQAEAAELFAPEPSVGIVTPS